MRVYEGMFLLDSGKAADWNAATAHVHGVLTRYGGTIMDSRKWDERRLAYDVDGRRRGTYMLVYFDAPRPNIDSIRHDLELSDVVLRYMFVVREKYEPPAAKAESPGGAEAEAAPKEPAGAETPAVETAPGTPAPEAATAPASDEVAKPVADAAEAEAAEPGPEAPEAPEAPDGDGAAP